MTCLCYAVQGPNKILAPSEYKYMEGHRKYLFILYNNDFHVFIGCIAKLSPTPSQTLIGAEINHFLKLSNQPTTQPNHSSRPAGIVGFCWFWSSWGPNLNLPHARE